MFWNLFSDSRNKLSLLANWIFSTYKLIYFYEKKKT